MSMQAEDLLHNFYKPNPRIPFSSLVSKRWALQTDLVPSVLDEDGFDP